MINAFYQVTISEKDELTKNNLIHYCGLQYFCQKVKLSTNFKTKSSKIVNQNLLDFLCESRIVKLSKKVDSHGVKLSNRKNWSQPGWKIVKLYFDMIFTENFFYKLVAPDK